MKCPICGQELRPGKKDPNYLLCYNCKKKFKVPQAGRSESADSKYSNIPPKHVRDKREKEMRRAYDEMLAVEDEKGRKKKESLKSKRRDDYDYDDYDDYDDVYDDEPISKVPIIILGVAILIVVAVIIYMLFFKNVIF